MIDNWLVITEDLVIILPVCLSMSLTICYTLLYVLIRQACANSVDPDEMLQKAASHQGLHCLPIIQLFLDTTLGDKLYMFKFKIKYGKELRCLDTKGKYGKLRH